MKRSRGLFVPFALVFALVTGYGIAFAEVFEANVKVTEFCGDETFEKFTEKVTATFDREDGMLTFDEGGEITDFSLTVYKLNSAGSKLVFLAESDDGLAQGTATINVKTDEVKSFGGSFITVLFDDGCFESGTFKSGKRMG